MLCISWLFLIKKIKEDLPLIKQEIKPLRNLKKGSMRRIKTEIYARNPSTSSKASSAKMARSVCVFRECFLNEISTFLLIEPNAPDALVHVGHFAGFTGEKTTTKTGDQQQR